MFRESDLSSKIETTKDFLLHGAVTLHQPKEGYRVGIDPVLLAASIQHKKGQKILDAGAGVGAASLCAAKRCLEADVHGLEIQPQMVEIAKLNVTCNEMEDRVFMHQGPIQTPPLLLKPNSFHHVITNPPHLEAKRNLMSLENTKIISRYEGDVGLRDWIRFCVRMVAPKGYFTIIHRADRSDELIAHINSFLGSIGIFPLWPKQGKSAKLILIQGRKGVRGKSKLCSGLVLHDMSGEYTKEARDVLSGASMLNLE